ncbi:MAG: peptidoglycan-binding protein [Acidobacteria bacterium]|nr:peptidoglycan-binding protein [Acidobacteriota bacterium]
MAAAIKRPADHVYGEREMQLVPECKGRDVWELQIKLIAWGSGTDRAGIGAPLMPVRVTGSFDRATHDAVKRFQAAAGLPLTGVVDATVFRELDREAARWPVLVETMRCPCAAGKNRPPLRCRCTDHDPDTGQCTGFGKGRQAGNFLLSGKKLPDGTVLDPDNLDIYDMKEYPGIDKALLWALRGMMRRLALNAIHVESGYRCWTDNYNHTDARRWRHRRATFHFGKSVELAGGACNHAGLAPNTPCAVCAGIRDNAVRVCGFQLRWQEPDRVTVAGADFDGPSPATRAVHVSTVRRRGREEDEFVQTFTASVRPVFPGKLPVYSFPMDLGQGLNPRLAPTAPFYLNTESHRGGRYPAGASRIWHGGIHLYAAAGTEVRAIADGELVGCRLNEAETAKAFGSRNFALLRHSWKNSRFFSLYMHLDNGPAAANSAVPWRRKLYLRTKDHAIAVFPCPFFRRVVANNTSRLVPVAGHDQGLGPRDWAELQAGAVAVDPRAAPAPLDDSALEDSEVLPLAAPADTYIYRIRAKNVLSQRFAPDAALAGQIAGTDVIGLANPIPVHAGELIGQVAAPPTDAAAGAEGAFVHLETFSGQPLPLGGDLAELAAAGLTQVADRKLITLRLKANDLSGALPSDVWLDMDIKKDGADVCQAAWRNTMLRAPCMWGVNWKAALRTAQVFSFMKDADRDRLGDDMNEYCWWAGVNAASPLPGPDAVCHYHPIVLLMQLALG